MFSRIKTFGISGTRAFSVSVETDINRGIPYYDIVGLGNEAVKESKKRVKAAIMNEQFAFPSGHITQNLAPADVRKQGTSFDLALALGILAISVRLPQNVTDNIGIVGEVSLDGGILPVKGVLPCIVCGLEAGIKRYIVPEGNLTEALNAPGAEILPVRRLKDAFEILTSDENTIEKKTMKSGGKIEEMCSNLVFEYDFSNVYGQSSAKRALEIAAAGKHNILLTGSPGSGKTLMARCLKGIMPPMSYNEYFQVLQIYSSCGLEAEVINNLVRPFRIIHQGVTKTALIGGGRPVEIGELSLAHNGVIFMDEFSETPKYIIEALRQPLEEKKVYITNCGVREALPANFMFVGSANPCPCGNFYERNHSCVCSPGQINTYIGKISGPVIDRIDINVAVRSVAAEQIGVKSEETSLMILERVKKAREIQNERFKDEGISCNGDVENISYYRSFDIDKKSRELLDGSVITMGLSVRAYNKILKVARTIADLSGSEKITEEHILESIQLRSGERYFGRIAA